MVLSCQRKVLGRTQYPRDSRAKDGERPTWKRQPKLKTCWVGLGSPRTLRKQSWHQPKQSRQGTPARGHAAYPLRLPTQFMNHKIAECANTPKTRRLDLLVGHLGNDDEKLVTKPNQMLSGSLASKGRAIHPLSLAQFTTPKQTPTSGIQGSGISSPAPISAHGTLPAGRFRPSAQPPASPCPFARPRLRQGSISQFGSSVPRASHSS